MHVYKTTSMFTSACKYKLIKLLNQIVKLEKLFWFLMSLIAFAVAYIISMMQTGFLMATCVFISYMFI